MQNLFHSMIYFCDRVQAIQQIFKIRFADNTLQLYSYVYACILTDGVCIFAVSDLFPWYLNSYMLLAVIINFRRFDKLTLRQLQDIMSDAFTSF